MRPESYRVTEPQTCGFCKHLFDHACMFNTKGPHVAKFCQMTYEEYEKAKVSDHGTCDEFERR
jgi:hypothetical protein